MKRQISIVVEEDVLKAFDATHGKGKRSTAINAVMAASLEKTDLSPNRKEKPPANKSKKTKSKKGGMESMFE